MDRILSLTVGIPITDQYSHNAVGSVKDVLIDSSTGKIAAFLMARGQMVVPMDVVDWNSNYMSISDSEHIVDLNEVIRVREIMEKRIPIFASKVFTEGGQYLGRVVDIVFNGKTFEMAKIYVSKLFLFFRYQNRIISVRSIIDIREDKIIVRDLLEKEISEAEVPSLSAA